MLKSKSYRHSDKYVNIIDDAKYVVFGVSSPTDEKEDEEPEIIDMPLLKTEKSTEQEGQWVKVLTRKQLITRLPILLAQLKAGNNSKKLKNEIRQLK